MYITTPYPSAYVLAKFCSFPPLLDAPKEQATSCLQEGICSVLRLKTAPVCSAEPHGEFTYLKAEFIL